VLASNERHGDVVALFDNVNRRLARLV